MLLYLVLSTEFKLNMWENVYFYNNICYHFATYIAFLYHDNYYIIYHDYHGIINANQSNFKKPGTCSPVASVGLF